MATQSVAGYNGIARISTDGGSTYTAIAELRNVTLSVTTDSIDASSHATGTTGWKAKINGLSEWGADAEFLAIPAGVAESALLNAIVNKTPLYFQFDPFGTATGKPRRSGIGRITSWSEDQPLNDVIACKVKIEGDGALTISTQ